MNKLSAALVAGLAAGAMLLSGTTAGAATAKGAPAAGRASRGASLSPPTGYTVVTSAAITATNGKQSHGSMTCPGRDQVSGGGAFVESTSLSVGINSSYPSGQTWEVDVNNTSGADTFFTVYAVCLAASRGYVVVSNSGVATHGTQTSLQATCPAHTMVLSGGELSSSASTAVNLVSTFPPAPRGKSWLSALYNNDTVDSNFTVYAICHPKPKGFSIQVGPQTTNVAGTQTLATVSCPGASVPVGGGGGGGLSSTAVNLNSSYPTSSGWAVYQNNGSTFDTWVVATVVCAGT